MAPVRLAHRLRRNAGAILIDGFFRGISRAGRLHPNANPERHNVEVLRDVPYCDAAGDRHHPDHHLDVYRPIGTRPGAKLPVVLYVHGGGFRILSKDTHWIMGLAFARRGYVVFNISYRLAPRHPFPAAIEDTCTAFNWVSENADLWGGDPNCIVLAGESAGANLVTSLTIASCYERPEPYARAVFERGTVPRAVLPACGILQVTDPDRFRRRWPHMPPFVHDRVVEVSRGYLRGTQHLPAGALDLADPLLVFERGERPQRPLPPFFVVCGLKDPLLDDARRLQRALTALDAHCEVEFFPGEMHAFHAVAVSPNARRAWRHTYRFLERHTANKESTGADVEVVSEGEEIR
jgi:acetyl esterase